MTLVFTNGCFDLIHQGHLDLLKKAKSMGSELYVGINSDDSVKRLKGSKRPINCQSFRVNLLESMKYVDKVFLFEEDTPLNLIKQIKPHILVKGGDYKINEVVGADFVRSYGGNTIIIPITPGFSTTDTIKNIKNK